MLVSFINLESSWYQMSIILSSSLHIILSWLNTLTNMQNGETVTVQFYVLIAAVSAVPRFVLIELMTWPRGTLIL